MVYPDHKRVGRIYIQLTVYHMVVLVVRCLFWFQLVRRTAVISEYKLGLAVVTRKRASLDANEHRLHN